MIQNCNTSIPHNSPPNKRVKHKLSTVEESCQQLELFPLLKKRQKPQISSVPGVSPKDPKRYRVKLGDEILGDKLTLDEALHLINSTNVLSFSNNLKSRRRRSHHGFSNY